MTWFQLDLWSSATANIIRYASFTFLGALLTHLYVWYQPFYHQSINTWYSVTSALLAWMCVSETVHWVRREITGPERTSGFDSGMVAFFAAFIVVPLTVFALSYRIKSVRNTDVFRLRNAYEFELKVRDFLRRNHPRFRQGAIHDRQRMLLANAELEDEQNPESAMEVKFQLGPMQGTNGSRFFAFSPRSSTRKVMSVATLPSEETGATTVAEADILKEVRSMYTQGVEQFKTSAQICLFQIYFYQAFHELERGAILSRIPLLAAKERSPAFDIEFRLFKLRSELKSGVASGTEVTSFVEAEKLEREGRQFDRLACFSLLKVSDGAWAREALSL